MAVSVWASWPVERRWGREPRGPLPAALLLRPRKLERDTEHLVLRVPRSILQMRVCPRVCLCVYVPVCVRRGMCAYAYTYACVYVCEWTCFCTTCVSVCRPSAPPLTGAPRQVDLVLLGSFALVRCV